VATKMGVSGAMVSIKFSGCDLDDEVLKELMPQTTLDVEIIPSIVRNMANNLFTMI
jgi:hypothetical protein